jgi:hypothetical protein
MRTAITLLAATLLTATTAHADPYCDTLLGFIHDAPTSAVATVTEKSSAGERQLAKVPLPGARCEITPYNPTGVAKDHPPEQSVYCFRSANEDAYHQLLDRTNAQVAECLGQDPQDDTFTTRLEYQSNLGSVRVSADQMTNDWAVSVTVMPLD